MFLILKKPVFLFLVYSLLNLKFINILQQFGNLLRSIPSVVVGIAHST